MKELIDRLIIAAGQWQRFEEKQFEKQFNDLFLQLQQYTNTDYNGALAILLNAINGEVAA